MIYMTTRKISAIFTAMIVAATAITLLTSTTAALTTFVLAAKTSSKNSNGVAGISTTDKSGVGSNTDGNTTNYNTPSASSDNENLKNLFACESAAAGSLGQLTKTDLINCYSQTFPDNSVSSGSSNSPEGDIGANSSSSDSGSSTSNHTHHHHHSSGTTSDSTTGPSQGP
jgi:hypothetical protein